MRIQKLALDNNMNNPREEVKNSLAYKRPEKAKNRAIKISII